MPGSAVGVGIGQSASHGTVYRTPAFACGITVDGRTGERMPELDARILHGDQRRGLSRNQICKVQPQQLRGTSKHRHLTAIDGRCQHEKLPGALRKGPEALEVDVRSGGPCR